MTTLEKVTCSSLLAQIQHLTMTGDRIMTLEAHAVLNEIKVEQSPENRSSIKATQGKINIWLTIQNIRRSQTM